MIEAVSYTHLDVYKRQEMGFSDAWIAALAGKERAEIKALRERQGIVPAFKMVDTCAAEFEAQTPYYCLLYTSRCV